MHKINWGDIISVLEINLKAIKSNFELVKNKIKVGQKICVVVKANAYGFGAKEVVKTLQKDADYFAVSSAYEYFEINKLTSKPILILDPIYDENELKKLIGTGAELSVCNLFGLEKIIEVSSKLNKKAKVHIVINTGMNRFGFKEKRELVKLLHTVKKTQNLYVLGVFSHYFQANNKNFANLQYNKFNDIKIFFNQNLPEIKLFHLANSDGLEYKNGFDMVRVGMALYTDKEFQTVSLSTKIVDVQNLSKGEVAGYDAVFKATKSVKLASIQIGYGDGIFRNIVSRGYVLINGKFSKIVAVCMDCMIVDITEIDAKIGDEVTVIGKNGDNQIFICDVASWCDTIDYEIIIGLAERVKRRYISWGFLCKLLQANTEQENLMPFVATQQGQLLQG